MCSYFGKYSFGVLHDMRKCIISARCWTPGILDRTAEDGERASSGYITRGPKYQGSYMDHTHGEIDLPMSWTIIIC